MASSDSGHHGAQAGGLRRTEADREPTDVGTPAPRAAGKQLPHRDDIQGLRAVAVLLVALAHAGVPFLAGGFVGVDVFFVLSGFLITSLLISEARRRRHVSLADFYLRRARRILPAATLTLIVTDLASYHLLNYVRARQYLQDSISSALFSANVHFAAQGTNYFAIGQPPSPLQHFWSLAVEEQFYFVWPLLFALMLGLSLRRYARRPRHVSDRAVRRVLVSVGVIVLASLAWSILDTQTQPAAAYFSTFARAWELGLGAALAVAARRVARVPAAWRAAFGWTGVGCILVSATTFSGVTPFPGYAALLPTLGCALVIAAGMAAPTRVPNVARLLSLAPLRYVGDRSYAFYLWHWPVLVIAAQHAGHSLSLRTNLLLLLAAFALSVLSYRLIEKPVRSAKWARKPQAMLPFAVSVAAVLVLATTYTWTIDGRELSQRLQAATVAPPTLTFAPQAPLQPVRVAGSAGPSMTVSVPVPTEVVNAVARANAARPLPAVLVPPVGDLLNDVFSLPPGCSAYNGQSTSRLCRLVDPSSTRTVIVLGDSHANMWIPDIEALARQKGWAVVPLTKSGCGPLDWASSIGPADCHAWFRWAMRQIRTIHPYLSLISGFYSFVGPGYYALLTDGLDAAIRSLKPESEKVVLIGDVPERSRQPVDCLLSGRTNESNCWDSVTSNEAHLTLTVGGLAQAERVAFVDTTGWFCYQLECPLVVADYIAYRDANHVSQTYATALVDAFRAAIDSAMARERPKRPS